MPLAAITDPDLFFTAIAGTLGLQESGDVSLADVLKEYLGRRELSLVLDNLEQVLSAVPLVGELLSAVPRLEVLAASRIPLGIYGEHEYAVPDLGALSQCEAVSLSRRKRCPLPSMPSADLFRRTVASTPGT